MNLAEELSGSAGDPPTLRVDTEATNIISLAEQGLVTQAPVTHKPWEDFTDHFHSPLNEW